MSDTQKKSYSVKETVEMPRHQISEIISEMSRHSLKIIEKAYQEKLINDNEYEALKMYYSDPDKVYRHTYRAIYDLFKQPEKTCAIDLNTGKVEKDENGNPIDYTLKAVTPFTDTQLLYYDKFHNHLRVIFPEMKSVERAIEKLLYEYGKEYNQDLKKISDIAFIDEDREAFASAFQNVEKTTSKLHDILRLTVTCKYKSDVERIAKVFQKDRTLYKNTSSEEENKIKENEPYYIVDGETRNRFNGKLSKNPKMYYDIKIVLHIPDELGNVREVEIQLKIHTLYMADIRTHKLYEEVRKIEKEIEAKGNKIEQKELAQKNAKKTILLNRIAQINKNAIHQYNMMVVDKIRRIEDDGYIPIGAEPEHTDGTYQYCREFLYNEYMPESLNDFEAKESFNPDGETNKMCFLRMIGKLDPTFDEFAPSASLDIEEAFDGLSQSERSRFEGIYQISNRYGQIIQNAINHKRIQDNGFESVMMKNLYQR